MAKELTLSNSKIKTYTRCPKQYHFKYVRKLKRKKRAIQLERGSWLHELLMVHYDGEDWQQRHKELTDEFNNLFEEEREDLGDLPNECLRIMVSYLRHYRDEDKLQHTVATELDETLELPNGLKFRFIIDRIYEHADGGLWLKDYKSVKKFYPSDFMLLDAQLTRYYWAAEKLGFTNLQGIEYDQIRTKPPTIPPLLKSGRLTEKKNQDTDYWTYLREIKRLGQDPKDYLPTLRRLNAQHEKFFRRRRLPRDKPMTRNMMAELIMHARHIRLAEKRDEFPRVPDVSCTFSCDFLEPCTIELEGGDSSDAIKLNYVSRKKEDD